MYTVIQEINKGKYIYVIAGVKLYIHNYFRFIETSEIQHWFAISLLLPVTCYNHDLFYCQSNTSVERIKSFIKNNFIFS